MIFHITRSGEIKEQKYEKPADFTLETVHPDGEGGLYLVGDKAIYRLRGGKVTPFAMGFTDLTAGAIAVGPDKALYVADGNLVKRVNSDGTASKFGAEFKLPFGLAFDSRGNLCVVDAEAGVIHRVDPTGKTTPFAGTGRNGHKDGPASQAEFCSPSGITFDSKGNCYVKESGRQEPDIAPLRIRKITPDGRVNTLAKIDCHN